jgi:nitroreductase
MAWERETDDGATDPVTGLTPLLDRRWSSRVFDPAHELTDGDLTALLHAARWAPSAGNSQPWAFLVGRRDDPTHRAFVELLSRGNAFWAPRASALLITLHRTASEPGSEFLYSEYAQYDLGQAAAHLTVQAQSMGLAVHQFAGFDHDRVATVFGVPDHWRVTTAIAVGRPAPVGSIEGLEPSLAIRERQVRRRNPLSDFVFDGRFGQSATWTVRHELPGDGTTG